MKKITKIKNHSGFYLLEAIIAIFLLTVGLLVVVDLISKVMSNTTQDRDNIIAVMLAQEGVELVRNLRDNNFAKGLEAFDTGTFPDFSTGNPKARCIVDKNSTRITCGSATTVIVDLALDANNYYVHTGTSGEKFKRRLHIALNGSAPDEYVTVTSEVIWNRAFDASLDIGNIPTNCHAANKCAYAQTILTKWE